MSIDEKIKSAIIRSCTAVEAGEPLRKWEAEYARNVHKAQEIYRAGLPQSRRIPAFYK